MKLIILCLFFASLITIYCFADEATTLDTVKNQSIDTMTAITKDTTSIIDSTQTNKEQTQAEPSFYTKYIEPVIVVTVTATVTLLLFFVRSKK